MSEPLYQTKLVCVGRVCSSLDVVVDTALAEWLFRVILVAFGVSRASLFAYFF